MFKNVIGALTALSLATVPAMASAANPAAPLSVSNSIRSGAQTADKNAAAGGGVIIALAIVAGIVAIGVIAATKDDDVNRPTSP